MLSWSWMIIRLLKTRVESELTEIFESITRCLVVTVNTINISIVVHHTITPSQWGLRIGKNGICQLCQGAPTTWWMATHHPFPLLTFIHLKISPTVMRRERRMVSYYYSGWLAGWLGAWVDCHQRKVNRLERSDNNSQSSGWLTLPAWPPHLTYQCLAVFPWFISDCAGLKISINFAPAPSEDWRQKQTLEDWLWNKNSVLSGGDWSSGPRILLSLLHLLCLFLLTRQLQPYPKQNLGSSSNQ